MAQNKFLQFHFDISIQSWKTINFEWMKYFLKVITNKNNLLCLWIIKCHNSKHVVKNINKWWISSNERNFTIIAKNVIAFFQVYVCCCKSLKLVKHFRSSGCVQRILIQLYLLKLSFLQVIFNALSLYLVKNCMLNCTSKLVMNLIFRIHNLNKSFSYHILWISP